MQRMDVFLKQLICSNFKMQVNDNAFFYKGKSYTYQTILNLADDIREAILSKDPSSKPIAIKIVRSPLYCAAILACCSLDRPFVPISEDYSDEHTDYIFKDAEVSCLLTNIAEDGFSVTAYKQNNENTHENSGQKIFAIFYTSGSTGVSKGVLIPYNALQNRFKWMWARFPYQLGEVQLFRSNTIFIDSVWESLGAFLCGIPTLIAEKELVSDPCSLLTECAKFSVSRITVVPSYLKVLLQEFENHLSEHSYLQQIKYWLVSGEIFPIELAKKLLLLSPKAVVINLYGSTEVMGDVTYHVVTQKSLEKDTIPIGVAIDNTTVAVFDDNNQSCSTEGIIAVSGYNLAAGYTKDPFLHQGSFLKLYNNGHEVIWFLTGDVGKFSDGELFYLGRKDHQVKIRGIKVNLCSIEQMVSAINLVKHVAAVKDNLENVVLFIEPKFSGKEAIISDEVQKKINAQLMKNIQPKKIIFKEKLPKTISGKIDYAALLKNLAEETIEQDHALPLDNLYSLIEAVISNVLEVKNVDRDKNLFDLGLNSLNSIHIVGKLRKLVHPKIKIRDIFDYPTVNKLADCIANFEKTEV